MTSIKIKPVLFIGKKYSDNKSPIFIRLTLNRKVVYLSVGKSAKPENWDSENNNVYEKAPKITPQHKAKLSEKEYLRLKDKYKRAEVLKDAIKINSDIDSKIKEVEGKEKELEVLKKPITLKIIKDEIDSKGKVNHNSFILYATNVANDFLDMGNISSYKSCVSVIKKLKDFRKGKDILFEDMDNDLLKAFEKYLNNEVKNKANTINKNFRIIRSILYKAIKEEKKNYFEQSKNPFFTYSIKKLEPSNKAGLSIEELKKIINLDLSNKESLIDARNYFLFCFYNSGMRIKDLLLLRWKNIDNGRLTYNTSKSNYTKEMDLKLRPEANDILSKYRLKEVLPNDFIFPILDNNIKMDDKLNLHNQVGSKTALINKDLKKIKKLAEINKPLSTHISRHSFGNIARKSEASIIDISRALGHSSIKITETYLQNLDKESQDKTLDKIYKF